MADNKALRGQHDRTRINLSEDYEVEYWTKKWGITKEQLAAAVKTAGPSSGAVAHILGKNV